MIRQKVGKVSDYPPKEIRPILINPIINCEFEYQCNLDWDRLEKTCNEYIRYCNTCKKNVELCIENQKIDMAWTEGRCVAHPMYTVELIKKIKAYESGDGDFPFQDISMPMGLPKRS
jgi:hypothetical protein